MPSLILIRLLLLSSISHLVFGAVESNPLLVVLLMVKNEKEVIKKTLETLTLKNDTSIKNWRNQTAYILYDTGSTDGTQQLATEFFKEKEITQYHIIEEPFIDFALSRNNALAHARMLYPTSTYILFPDAEWYLHDFEKLFSFCVQQKEQEKAKKIVFPPYYRIAGKYFYGNNQHSDSGFMTARLFLTQDDVKFSLDDEVHECPNKCSGASLPEDIFFEIGMSKFGYEKSRKRWEHDRIKLLKKHTEHPDRPRPLLYLAKTEKALGNNLAAYTYFKKRVTMSTFPEEDYWAWYNLAEVTELLCDEAPEKFNWSEAFTYYEKAHALRPHRAEPLVKIAQHYFFKEKNFDTSFIYARRAIEKPIPTIAQEILPIHFNFYEFERWYILSLCAWYVQEYELGLKAAQQAIEARPNYAHLYKNLSYYWERK